MFLYNYRPDVSDELIEFAMIAIPLSEYCGPVRMCVSKFYYLFCRIFLKFYFRNPMEFESAAGIFSPDGRLIQIENAQHASAQGAIATLQVRGSEILVSYENAHMNPLFISQERIHCVDSEQGIYMLFSGLKPDSIVVREKAIGMCCNYRCKSDESISIKILAKKIGEFKQKYTVDLAYRPLGLRSVLFGVEEGRGRIFIIEPDGNYAEYERCAVGFKNEKAMEYLDEHSDEYSFLRALQEVSQSDAAKKNVYSLKERKLVKYSQEEVEEILSKL